MLNISDNKPTVILKLEIRFWLTVVKASGKLKKTPLSVTEAIDI